MSLRKDIVVLLIVDLLFLLLMEVGLRNIPAPFPVFVKFGDFFVTLAISFVASFIFYFVQVHMPNIKEKHDLYPNIAILFNRMINAEKALLTNYVNVKPFDALTEDNIKKVWSREMPVRWMHLCFLRALTGMPIGWSMVSISFLILIRTGL